MEPYGDPTIQKNDLKNIWRWQGVKFSHGSLLNQMVTYILVMLRYVGYYNKILWDNLLWVFLSNKDCTGFVCWLRLSKRERWMLLPAVWITQTLFLCFAQFLFVLVLLKESNVSKLYSARHQNHLHHRDSISLITDSIWVLNLKNGLLLSSS